MTELYEGSQQESGGLRKGLTVTIIVVCVAAILGGMAVVSLGSPDDGFTSADYTRSEGARVKGMSEQMSITFNPRNPRPVGGSRIARVTFKFAFSCHPSKKRIAIARIHANWELLKSRNLMELIQRTPVQFKNKNDIAVLETDLIRTMNAAIFDNDHLAEVDMILWDQIIVQ